MYIYTHTYTHTFMCEDKLWCYKGSKGGNDMVHREDLLRWRRAFLDR
jgi:hypothetical protein